MVSFSALGYTGREFEVSGGSTLSRDTFVARTEVVAHNPIVSLSINPLNYQTTVNGDNYSVARIQNKISSILNKLSQLAVGWDGRGAIPVDPQSIENVKAIAQHLWSWNFKLWQIAPGVNGEIFINYKGKNKLAGFVIGPNTFSYFIEDETLQGDSNIPFDGLRVSTLMNTIVNA